MLGHAPVVPQGSDRLLGTRSLRWSWILLAASWPWHLVGGAIAIGITWLAGGDFTDSIGVPQGVYLFLYIWMLTPLVASFVVGMIGWLRGHRPAAIVPAALSACIALVVTIFGSEEFFG
jgi:hypothetical protein